ncbi:MAG: 4-amino-4-deoxy-L-arabinose transferase-like glycosyltransferase [Granulosicoccus sp.]|jgi:4-amino-4-deoxy-L-arabinose transferase-like glycosyltransferase
MNRKNGTSILIFLAALFAFVPMLGSVHLFDWDEINFAEAAREMLLTGEYTQVQIGFEPFWEKPPLFIWLQAICMHLFGISEFSARLPNAIAGAISLTLLYRLGNKWRNHQFGLIWSAIYAASFLPQFYFRSGIIDPWFNLFIFLGIERLIAATETKMVRSGPVMVSGLWVGLAVITKGPAALVIVSAIALVYLVIKWQSLKFSWFQPLLFLLIVVTIGFSWFIYELLAGNEKMVHDFVEYNIRLITKSEAGHGQPFYYHAVVLLIGCFPMSLLFLFGLKRKKFKLLKEMDHHRFWMLIMFWVVLIIFSVVKTKIIHYSSLTYFPMSFIAATVLYRWWVRESKPKPIERRAILVQAIVLGIVIFLAGNFEWIQNIILSKNWFSDQNVLDAISIRANWNGWEWIPGLILIVGSYTAIYKLKIGNYRNGISILISTSFLTIWLTSLLIMPRVEEFTQNGIIEFYKEKGAEGAYCKPLGFHSYAHLFYGDRHPDQHKSATNDNWLLDEKIDRPVFFTVRNRNLEGLLKHQPELVVLGQWGSFTFLTRGDENYPFLAEP